MKQITSKNNPFYKSLLRISKLKEQGRFLLEGIHLCEAYLEQGLIPECAIISETPAVSPEVKAILQSCDECPCYELGDSLFKGISSVPSPQGILFVARADQFQTSIDFDQPCILLDRLQDPGNLGTIIRTSAAAGVKQIVLSSETVKAWSPKVLRSAQGAHFAVNIHDNANLLSLIPRFALPVYACALGENQTSLYAPNLSMPAVWVFGNEGQGVSPEVMAIAEKRVIIPQTDLVESLNVAVAAAVTLFEQRRRLLQTDSADF